ncbi:hypothetical protein Amal_03919 [Acetobacter malorum]|uniref:Uncharacterized protein n=1 Tax=Acetobacter malorum TaxID=178901 RepID=A0A177G3E6_9PROT|nr:hypothetical protein Amal_03919 [Acetobacter malorum]
MDRTSGAQQIHPVAQECVQVGTGSQQCSCITRTSGQRRARFCPPCVHRLNRAEVCVQTLPDWSNNRVVLCIL